MTDERIMLEKLVAVERAAQSIAGRNIQLRAFLLRLLDPDDLGHAVSAEVRRKAHAMLLSKDESPL